MEEWAKTWLDKQRNKGEKGIEIKRFSNSYYVYRSTTYWDKELKKRRKKSIYLGRLDIEKGLIKSSKRVISNFRPRSIKQYGNAAILHSVLGDLQSLLKNEFEDVWQEIYALSLVRVFGYVPLKRVRSIWEKLYDPLKLNPSLSPGTLSKVLKVVGTDYEAQNAIFEELSHIGNQFVYDLSVVFTRSEGINFAELGYNKDKFYIPQINLALFYSVDKGLPTMIRALPGSVRDITSLYNSVKDAKIEGKILILDRGFFSMKTIDFLLDKSIAFLLPAKRNSKLYKTRIHLTKHFFYRDRLIKLGKKRLGRYFLYLFEDTTLKVEEEKTLYKRIDEKKISKNELKNRLNHAGKIIITSDLDIEGEEIFLMYKQRGGVEKLFDMYKNILHADKMYLQDDESIFGHLFTSFISLYAYCKIEFVIKKKGLLHKLSPLDVLEEFAKVYMIKDGEREIISEVPKKVAELDKVLGFNVFPK